MPFALPEPQWLSPPNVLCCEGREIHVWRASLTLQPEVLQSYRHTLSADEQQRAERFRFERDRHRFIASRGILRSLLGRYLSLAAPHLKFRYSATGKPALEEAHNPIGLEFNLSHTQSLMLCAIVLRHPVGIDLEGRRTVTDLSGLTQRFFSPKEHQCIQSLPDTERPFAFLQYWTCKEAILKATGDGLVQLSQVELELNQGKVTIARLGDRLPADLSLYPLVPAPNHLAALATTLSDCHLQFWQWAEIW